MNNSKTKIRNTDIFRICLPVMLASFLWAFGCNNNLSYNDQPASGDITTQTFISDQELKTYIIDQYAKNILPLYAYDTERMFRDTVATDTAETEAGDDFSAGSAGYSETNVQEKGVDEADVVKNDGRYIYITGDRTVRVVDTHNPALMEVISTITVDGRVGSLYLYKDLLVILFVPENGTGEYWPYAGRANMADIGFCYWLPINAETGLMIVDVSDPSNPQWKSETIIDGNMMSTRRVANTLYLVQQFLPELPPFDYYYDDDVQTREAVVQANHDKLDHIMLSDLIPFYRTIGPDGRKSEPVQLVSHDRFYRPSRTCGGSIITVTAMDLDDPAKPLAGSGMIADAHTVYASTSALYLASTQWNDAAYQNRSSAEVYHTRLFKFSFTDEGAIHSGAGGVNGKILNQFSLGEYEDVLRIATTSGTFWTGDGRIGNNLFCLQEEDGQLNIIGKIEDLAEGENIYAVRLLGPRGYIVTFVQIDPLFTLDLSDPYNPEVIGELKVPGFSNYIHPLDDDYLLTIGKEVVLYQGNPLEQGVQLSVFDIRDFKNPTLLHQEIIGDRGTYSEAQHSHKAFTYWSTNNLLAIPIDLYETAGASAPYEWGMFQYSGLFVYDLSTREGFRHLGTIKTSNNDFYDFHYNNWTRGIFINDHVFAVKQQAVQAAEYDAINTTANRLDLNP